MEDERDGMSWWNASRGYERAYWLRQSASQAPVAAWHAFRAWSTAAAAALAAGGQPPAPVDALALPDLMATVVATARLMRRHAPKEAPTLQPKEISLLAEGLEQRHFQACAEVNRIPERMTALHDEFEQLRQHLLRGDVDFVRAFIVAAAPPSSPIAFPTATPPDVPPIHHAGVVYAQAPDGRDIGADQIGGVLVARNAVSGAVLWTLAIHDDVADARGGFFASMTLQDDGRLRIVDDAGKTFLVDVRTQVIQAV
jgi:hypothetical protein